MQAAMGYACGGRVGRFQGGGRVGLPRFALGGFFGSPTMRQIDAIMTSLGGAFIPGMMANPAGTGFIQTRFGPSSAQRWFPETLKSWFGAERSTELFGPRTIGGDRYGAYWTRDGGLIKLPRFAFGGPVRRYQMGGEVAPIPMPVSAAAPVIINNSFHIQTPSAESFARSRLQVEAMMGRSMERALRRGGA